MNKSDLLIQIEKNVANCKKCRLHELANKPVPGEGNYDSKLIFIGEAPGANEDATGRPFVGRAGNLLEKLLGQIGYKREDVWIGNIIKHRPPQNRDPLPDEVAACAPYLAMQLKALNPLLIVTLGRYAMNYFYADGKIQQQGTFNAEGKLHGTWKSYDVNGNKLAVGTYENNKKVGKWFFWTDGVLKEVDYLDSKIASVSEWKDKTKVAVRNK